LVIFWNTTKHKLPPKKYPPHFRKRTKKFRFLLDAAFAKPDVFVKLSKKANLAHVYHTYGLPRQAEDGDIYILGCREDRLIVSADNDFKKYVKKGGTGVLVIRSHLSNEQIDDLLLNFVKGRDPENCKGKVNKLGYS